MNARAWDNPDAEPDVVALLLERGSSLVPQAEIERAVHAACDAWAIGPGTPLQRLALLREAGERREAEPLSGVAADVLDSLVGCALNTRQLCEDTGMEYATISHALERLRAWGLVTRERRGGVWTYRATAAGRRAHQRHGEGA